MDKKFLRDKAVLLYIVRIHIVIYSSTCFLCVNCIRNSSAVPIQIESARFIVCFMMLQHLTYVSVVIVSFNDDPVTIP